MKRTGFATVVATVLGLAISGVSGVAQDTKTVRATLAAQGKRKLAPNFALKDTSGKVTRLSDYRGRVVLLDFWATTCGGCVEEIPIFIELARAYERQGLATIGVAEDIAYANLKNADAAWARVRPFVREHKVGYTVVMGDSRVTTDYDIQALPLTYLIDAKGRVAAAYNGVVQRSNMEANIKTLLAEAR